MALEFQEREHKLFPRSSKYEMYARAIQPKHPPLHRQKRNNTSVQLLSEKSNLSTGLRYLKGAYRAFCDFH